jgi:hypothetical protein
MFARDEREALLRVVNRLSSELGHGAEPHPPGAQPARAEIAGALAPDDEWLVSRIRGALARVAAAREAEGDDRDGRLLAALDAAETILRGELLFGAPDRLPTLLPALVFLVTLPVVNRDEALELSQRAAWLIERELGRRA